MEIGPETVNFVAGGSDGEAPPDWELASPLSSMLPLGDVIGMPLIRRVVGGVSVYVNARLSQAFSKIPIADIDR